MQGKIALEEHFGVEIQRTPLLGVPDSGEQAAIRERLEDTGEARLEEMDRWGIAVAVLSLAAPGVQDEVDPRKAASIAAHANDALAEIVAAHPGRYAGLAALPLQDPEGAADELERAVRELGFKGALANGFSVAGDPDSVAYYDEPAYLSFWERVAELGVPFYLHPRNPPPGQRRSYEGREELLGPAWAFAVETGTHALRLITSGLFDRLPGLIVIIGHLGELLPFAVERAEQRLSHYPSVKLEKSVPEYLRNNFYLTTSGNFHTISLTACIDQVGAERILFAVDWPFEEMAEGAEWFDAAPISGADREKIGRTNAKRLFRL